MTRDKTRIDQDIITFHIYIYIYINIYIYIYQTILDKNEARFVIHIAFGSYTSTMCMFLNKWYCYICACIACILRLNLFMMTSSNGSNFRVTGPLWGEPPVTGVFPSQRPMTRSFDIFFDLRLNKRSSNNRDAGDLRRNRAHYDCNVQGTVLSMAFLYFLQLKVPFPYLYMRTNL